MPLFGLCNSQGQSEVYRTFCVPVSVAGRLHVSHWVKQNNRLQRVGVEELTNVMVNMKGSVRFFLAAVAVVLALGGFPLRNVGSL